MIIKASLHTLRQNKPGEAALREAAADIDDEVVRLNRIVDEVLDFSRPIRFDFAPADIATLCRESAAAAQASPGAAVALDLDPALPTLVTDAERLRITLVNMLLNARHAVNGDPRAGVAAANTPEQLVTLKAAAGGGHVTITITDRGVGAPRPICPRLRSLLHHQTRRHRARPADRQEHRGRAWRHNLGVEQH